VVERIDYDFDRLARLRGNTALIAGPGPADRATLVLAEGLFMYPRPRPAGSPADRPRHRP
jgi:hypothetical protein